MKEEIKEIVSKLRMIEIFAWLLPGIVAGVATTMWLCHEWRWENMKDWIILITIVMITISGYVVYCLGFLIDAQGFRKRLENKKLPRDISIQEIVWENPQLLDVLAEGALYFNMGVAFVIASFLSFHCYDYKKYQTLNWWELWKFSPFGVLLFIGGLSFYCYYWLWLGKDYPEYLKFLGDKGH